MKELKELGVIVGVAAVVTLAVAIGVTLLVAGVGGAGVVRALRDLGIIILALLSLVTALIMAAVFGGLAFAVARWGPKAPAGIRWVGAKVLRVDAAVERGSEDYVVRPLAKTASAASAAAAFVGGLQRPLDAGERWSHEVTRWRTYLNRVRGRVTDGGTR
jgi:hypothetical protein